MSNRRASQPPVETVVINWKRPRNVTQIVSALRRQSEPTTITLIDCHPDWRYRLPRATLRQADRVYRLHRNLGSFNRYVPVGAYDHEFTFFMDDDMLPGSRCIEHYLDSRPASFGVLGQIGRRLNSDGTYSRRGVERTISLEPVDFLIRGYFVRTRMLDAVHQLRWNLGLEKAAAVEDDMLLAFAMQMEYGLDSYLTPHSDDPQTKQNFKELPSRHALARRPDHFNRRIALLEQAKLAGWRSTHGRGWTGESLDRLVLPRPG